MTLSESDLRAMVRQAIARAGSHQTLEVAAPAAFAHHGSHALFPLPRGGDQDGACLIEPSVRCTHCGYCLSYGH
jgi:hypothetical protein